MPNKIRRYPYPPDPRSPTLLITSLAARGAGPFKYRLTQTTGAPLIPELASGLNLTLFSGSSTDGLYLPTSPLSGGFFIAFAVVVSNAAMLQPDPAAVNFNLYITGPTGIFDEVVSATEPDLLSLIPHLSGNWIDPPNLPAAVGMDLVPKPWDDLWP